MITKRLEKITKIPEEYRSITPPAPRSVKIELTPRCNYRCQYCAILSRDEKPLKDMDWELFKRITTEMHSLGVEEIGVFYIGEPFISPKLLVEAIKFLKQDLGFPYVFLTSNGSLANPMIVEKCMHAGLDSLKWSCNAADPEQFAELTGMQGEIFDIAKDNINSAYRVRESGNYKTRLYASSIKYTENQPVLAKPFLDNHILPYVDQHYWLPLYTAGGQAKERENKLGFQPSAGNTGRLDDPAEPIPCWTLFTAAHIRYDGTMTACCLDGTGFWQMGDLKKETFMQAWHSEEFRKLRKAHIERNIIGTKCEKCVFYQ